MSKKPSKAKRSPAQPARKDTKNRRRIPRDADGHPLLFDPRTGKPTFSWPTLPPHERERIEAAERERRLLSRERRATRRAAFLARVNRQPAEMRRDGYTLPTDVAAFLRQFHEEPSFYCDDEHISVEQARELAEAAYMDGCREGYIEGFVVRREVDRQRSRAGNAAKRKTVVTVGTSKMPREQRDAAMVDEYAALLKLMKPTPACQRLADKYGFESWQGVAAAIKRFRQRAGG